MKTKKLITLFFSVLFMLFNFSTFSSPFNEKLTEEEKIKLENGEILIKNIVNEKRMCLNKDSSELSNTLFETIKDLSPNYLAEVIQIKPIQGNEDLPNKLKDLLNNVSDYAGIPYFSERRQKYFDLYTSAVITDKYTNEDGTEIIKADLLMQPFGTVNEILELTEKDNMILYTATNTNILRYKDKFNCVKDGNMKLCILLFQHEDNWILYGIGGVNAWRVPFFTERIETSFINRIKTFCEFIFKKI